MNNDKAGDIMRDGIPAIIEAARAQRGAEVIDVCGAVDVPEGFPVTGVPMLVTYDHDGGQRATSVLAEAKAWRDAFATRPVRRAGTATLEEQASFVEHANRFKDANSAIFVNGGAASPKFTSILDYHDAGGIDDAEPRFGTHRGTFSPTFSPEWKAWREIDGQALSQARFAEQITKQARTIFDVAEGGAGHALAEAPAWFAQRFARGVDPFKFFADSQRLLDLAEGLTVTVQDKVGDVARRDSGETKISFESERTTDIEIPVAFVIELPIFVGGALYQIPVRLRFALRQDGDTKRASWRIEMFGADATVLAVVAEMRAEIAKDTALPIFAGSPE